MENTVENKPKNVVWKLFQKFPSFILKPYHKVFTRLLLTEHWNKLALVLPLPSEVALVHFSLRFSQHANSSLLRFALTANPGLSAKGPRTHHPSAPTFLPNTVSMTTSE